ncbi:uncharacterized protein LOC133509894 isoform X2 [Syngnathoides biaculeatus]|uniref:uncharacterized protein LOC133509894 isoform X2 n=1 Tax=Syngnathoides biaculeatus TaxID=300417 RepID=UPI002ADD7B5D|nr:uncharacterized protein LOC133509894 isoform X2 [Syngnathoides biaculeatus]
MKGMSDRSSNNERSTKRRPQTSCPHPASKVCADQLVPVFTKIFNRPLQLCEVATCFKHSTIIPVPKKAAVSGLNDYRPAALTSMVMKSFERLLLDHLKSITGPQLDPLQFAYRANRSADDAVNLSVSPAISWWIYNFLTGRTQQKGLLSVASDCQTPEVSGRHHSHRPHRGRRHVCVSTSSSKIGALVWSTQPGSEHSKNSRDDCVWTSGGILHHSYPDTVQLSCVNRRDHQVLGNCSLRGPEEGDEHQLHSQKGPAKDVLLLAASEEARPVTRAAETVLHSGHPICTAYLHHGLVWGRYRKGQTQNATDNQNTSTEYWHHSTHY